MKVQISLSHLPRLLGIVVIYAPEIYNSGIQHATHPKNLCLYYYTRTFP